MACCSDCLDLVRLSCERVCRHPKHVFIDDKAVVEAVRQMTLKTIQSITSEKAFDSESHLVGRGDLTAQYLLVVDSLNFCFWPEEHLEYEHLAKYLKESVERDESIISSEQLATMDEAGLHRLLGRQFPNAAERARLLREVGRVLLASYGGQAGNLVRTAQNSAQHLVHLITSELRGFQDIAIHRGQQVAFYKRAQIFVGDLWGAFQGKDLGEFKDIDRLTMFADYRVPVQLKELGVLKYSKALEHKILQKQEIWPGSEEEVELRASSIIATEYFVAELRKKFNKTVHSIQLDWYLWESGERQRQAHFPHHRTHTIYY